MPTGTVNGRTSQIKSSRNIVLLRKNLVFLCIIVVLLLNISLNLEKASRNLKNKQNLRKTP